MHQEARGESIEGAMTLGQTAVELSLTLKTTICKLERSGQVQSSTVPAPLLPAFLALAKVSLKHPRLLSKGSDHWDKGRKPHMAGKIKRVVGKHVFYRLN